MNTNKKITKAMRFAEMSKIFTDMGRTDLAEFCDKQIELLAKKNTTKDGEKRMTATQKANEDTKADILDSMADNTAYTITQMIKEFSSISDLTNQKVSALMRQLVADGKVVRTEEKGVAYFTKA